MVVDFFPKIDIPIVFVGWNYPGLSAEEMERRVVIISERAYSTTVNGIERIESNCIPGIGLVKVYFHQGTNIGAAIAQINAINGTILRILPPGMHAAGHHPVQPGDGADRADGVFEQDRAGRPHVRPRVQLRAREAVHDSRADGARAIRRQAAADHRST